MARLKYVGRNPDSDSSVVHKGYVDTTYEATKVDTAYVAGRIANTTANLVMPSYVDAQDNLRAKKTEVTAADNNYIPVAHRGAPGGVAAIGSDGYIPSSQVPTVVTDRVPFTVAGSVTTPGVKEVISTSAKHFQVGTLTITDPGYPYQVLAFAFARGSAETLPNPGNRYGAGSYGRMVIFGPSDKVYAQGVTTGNYRRDFFAALPAAQLNTEPSVITGNLTLEFWISLQSGSSYLFDLDSAYWYAIVLPAI